MPYALFLYTTIVFCLFCCHELNFVLFSAVNNDQRALIVETFIKTNKSVTATQQVFRWHFNLGRYDPISSGNMILFWVTNFRATGSALKQKPTGGNSTARTPENVATLVNIFTTV